MEQHPVKIKSIQNVTHDVLQIVTQKPQQYNFISGQATDVSINKEGWQYEKSPFTFTSIPDNNYIEFTIKTYPSHKRVTNELRHLKINDELILHEVFGDIAYKGEGVFIAGGAGVTPFISIFRYLQSKNKMGNNKLIFANKTKADIILEQEFKKLLDIKFINILFEDNTYGYAHGYITEEFLIKHIEDLNKYIYLCGPPPMMDAIEKMLDNLHVNKKNIIKEAF
ncbi:MAG TPA: flavodoxin reductase [Bacteroidia bacterium]|nr:flavodoxin reductase [Bacteroidia bacterium]